MLRQLIDEALQIQEAKAADITITPDEITQSFSGVARKFNRKPDEMAKYLRDNGSSDRSLKRQIEGELAWQRYLRKRVNPFVNVGERTNVTGSAAFKKMILAGDYTRAVEVARSQVENGAQVVEQVHIIDELHKGEFRDREGDLIPGFAPTYRVSWGTTMGDIKLKKGDGDVWVSAPVIEPNNMNWSGGHVSVALPRVTGTFFSSKPVVLPAEGAHLLDIAPTVLSLTGVEVPEEMDHAPLRFKD